jgi:hypothetical protein
MAQSRVDDKEFITVWQKAAAHESTVDDVAEQLGITPARASQKAYNMRKHGVRLAKLVRRSKPRKDWKALADLADEVG